MGKAPRIRQRYWSCLMGGLVIPLIFPLISRTQTPDHVKAKEPPPASSPGKVQTLDLAGCLDLAKDRQPALDAYRASLAAAETNSRGLQKLKGAVIVREIPIRRQQAALGVTAASARLDQAEHETVYAVTRNYFTVLYAREQKEVTVKVVQELGDALANAKRLVEGGAKKPTQNDVEKLQAFLGLAEMRQAEAEQGINRANAALREALGVGSDYSFEVKPGKIPEPKVKVNRDDIMALALARRGEMTQANIAAQVFCLEVEAQKTRFLFPSFHTFASVVDIHAQQVPQGSSDGEWRPAAVGPEMPTTMAGARRFRVQRARDFHARADAVVDKTHNLIALEAEDAYWKWEEAKAKVASGADAVKRANQLAKNTKDQNRNIGEDAVPTKEVLEAVILAAQAEAQYNEARFKLVLALAALQRITAEGFCAGLISPVSTQP